MEKDMKSFETCSTQIFIKQIFPWNINTLKLVVANSNCKTAIYKVKPFTQHNTKSWTGLPTLSLLNEI